MMFPKPEKKQKAKKRLPRERKTPIAKLHKILNSVFSKYIVLRDRRCVNCGSTEKLTNGHLITRRKLSVRYDEENCNCQCWPCNFKHEFLPYPYFKWYIETKGKDSLDQLHERGNTIKKWTREELEGLINRYTKLLTEISQ